MRALLFLLASPLCVTVAQPREFRFVPDLKIDISKESLRQGAGLLAVSPSGRIVFLPEFYRGTFRVFDSTGAEQPFDLTIGRSRGNEIGWVQRVGWLGDSMWVADQAFDQLVVVGPSGRVIRSLERPSWVRPRWRDRRRYPLFSAMEWESLSPDGTMLVRPSRPRMIFDTPQYDRSSQYLVRTDRDGIILSTVARIPLDEGLLRLRDGTERRELRVDFLARPLWKTSSGGQRIAVVTQSRADSGVFHVTMLSAAGDTVFSRGYRAAARRVSPEQRDAALGRVQPFGAFSADALRDSLRKLMPAFHPPAHGLSMGVDGSVWVWVRAPDAPPQEWTAMIIDPAGTLVGQARLPRSYRSAEVSTSHVWLISRGERNAAAIERLRRAPATAAPPSRSARTAAPSSRSPR